MADNKRKRAEFTESERMSIISDLLERGQSKNGEFVLQRGAIQAVANKFDCNQSTVSRIWNQAKKNRADPEVNAYIAPPQKKGNCGSRFVYDREQVAEELARIPKNERRSIRSTADALGIPKSTLFNMLKEDNAVALAKRSGSDRSSSSQRKKKAVAK